MNVIQDISTIGKPYFKLRLRDKTGEIRAVRFVDKENIFEKLKEIYEQGNIITIEGKTHLHYIIFKITI